MYQKNATQIIHTLFNTPLLISASFESTIIKSTGMMLKSGVFIPPSEIIAKSTKSTASTPSTSSTPPPDNTLAIIPVYNYLSYRYDAVLDYFFGNTSYESIRQAFQTALADPSVKNIVFDINSPGGEVSGLFDLVDEIYAARGSKPIYAVFNDSGFSAAFAIATAADKRYISRTGRCGSVGVVMMHMDQSKWDEQMGLTYTPIYSGARKIDFSSHAPLTEEALAVARSSVDGIYDLFCNTTARNLGLTSTQVRLTEAGIYQGKQALETGFADSILSWNQFLSKLSSRKYGGVMKLETIDKAIEAFRASLATMIGGETHTDMVPKAEVEKLTNEAKAAGLREGQIAGIETGKESAHTRAVAILEACAVGKVDLPTALAYVCDEGKSVEAVKAQILDVKAAVAEATKITSTVTATSTGAVSPLLKDAQKRSEAATAQSKARI